MPTIMNYLYDVKKLFWQVRCQYDDQKKSQKENPPGVGMYKKCHYHLAKSDL